jgi:hypothetical protein
LKDISTQVVGIMEVNTGNPVDYAVKINTIEKSQLDHYHDQAVPKLSTNFDVNNLHVLNDCYIIERNQPLLKFLGNKILRIRGTSRTLSEEKMMTELFLMKDIISGLYGQRFPFFYLIIGKQNEISVNMGIQAEANDLNILASTLQSGITSVVTSLKGAYPGIELKIFDNSEIKTLKDFLFKAEHIGMLTGIPSPKTGTENIGIEQVERFIRGMYGDVWGYLVIADPVPYNQINTTFNDLVSEIKVTYPKIKESSTRGAAGQSITKENLDRSAQYYVELLESLLDRFKVGKSEGMWETSCYFFSPGSETFNKMGSLLKSTFSGEKSFPEPVRTFRISDGTQIPKNLITSFGRVAKINRITGSLAELLSPLFTTVLTSEELSSLSCIPKEEMPGYDIRLSARYGVDLPAIIREDEAADHQEGKIRIGAVKDRGENTHNLLSVNTRLFTKHCLICGITGSGKTNTCFSLLEQMWNKQKIPFLVIEPTKGEYRNLIDVIPESRVFTLGNETIAPFRMNPFEVPGGVHVQRHLDNLKAIFNASFTMYPPMPFVLEHCLINVYEKNGWNLAMNLQGRTPTLDDLYGEVDVVVKGLGYHTEIASNVRAALKTRIRSLLLGGKGKMLNCEKSIPLEEILKYPTILELKGVGDDEEKTFLMGILLGKLYEYREAGGNFDTLRHITLIEEAHRLLTNVPKGGEETNQAKAKAVETLCNILTEVRAYGEGIIIVDQVPTKLAPDAIKNTNMKIIHRIIAGDDREVIAQSIGLSEIQKRYLINLTVGETVVFVEHSDEPFMVQIPAIKDMFAGSGVQVFDAKLKEKMQDRYYKNNPLQPRGTGPFIGCENCDHKCDFRFMMEPLLADTKLQNEVKKALDLQEDKMIDQFKSVILPAGKALGYHDESEQLRGAKALCALIQILNTIPAINPVYQENVNILTREFKKRVIHEQLFPS